MTCCCSCPGRHKEARLAAAPRAPAGAGRRGGAAPRGLMALARTPASSSAPAVAELTVESCRSAWQLGAAASGGAAARGQAASARTYASSRAPAVELAAAPGHRLFPRCQPPFRSWAESDGLGPAGSLRQQIQVGGPKHQAKVSA